MPNKLTTDDKNLLFFYIRRATDLFEAGEILKSEIPLKASEWWQMDITIRNEGI
jgi:hypothetical protein